MIAIDFYNLIVKFQQEPIIEDGLSKDLAESTVLDLTTKLKENFKLAFTFNDKILIDDADLEALTTAYLNALNKLNVTCEIVSKKDGKHCSVKLTTTYINHKTIDEVAVDVALKEIDVTTYSDEQLYMQELSKVYVRELIKGYENATPSKETHSETFSFVLKGGLWQPEDYETFLSAIPNMIASQ